LDVLQNLHSIPPSSTPTPMSQHNENIRRTRSGRPISTVYRADSPHASTARSSSPKRKPRKVAKEKANIPKLTAPLSVLTKDMTNVPVRDMEAWVQRSLEDRQKEAEKRKGYITRPMNSFMLYRSAYAERTKAWCSQNNHQVVSSVSGASWPLEPPEVREFYNNLAKIERHNHQLAHPNYKFSPAKPGTSNRKRKGTDDIEESDVDGDWAITHGVKNSRRVGRDASYPARSAPTLGSNDQTFINRLDPYSKVWEPSPLLLGVRPPPYPLANPLPSQQHHPYQLYETAYYPTPQVDHRSPHEHLLTTHPLLDTPDLGFGSGLVGLPGSSFHELTDLRSQVPTPAVPAPIDPRLDDGTGGIHEIGYLPYDTAGPGTRHYAAAYSQLLIPEDDFSSYLPPHLHVVEEQEEEQPTRRIEQRHEIPVMERRISVQDPVEKARQDSWQRGLNEIHGLEHVSEFETFLGGHVGLNEVNHVVLEESREVNDEVNVKPVDDRGSERSGEKSPKTT
jgi:HMG (high mobility group) box